MFSLLHAVRCVTKGTNVLKPVESVKRNVEHGRTDRTNVTRRRNKIPGHRT